MAEKAFGAFVMQAAKAGAGKAQALAIYVRSRGATWHDVRNEITRSIGAGAITLDRAERLLDFLDEAKAYYESFGKEIVRLLATGYISATVATSGKTTSGTIRRRVYEQRRGASIAGGREGRETAAHGAL